MKLLRHNAHDGTVMQHPDLDCIHPDVRHHSFHLRSNHLGRDSFYRRHTAGILSRHRRDRRHAEHSQRRKCLEIRLNTCPPSAVRPRNTQHTDIAKGTFRHLHNHLP